MTLETRNVAIQDTYGERFQHCWGCGPKNDLGLHLKTYPSVEGTSCISRIKVDQQYTGGVPANLFGGMIAVIGIDSRNNYRTLHHSSFRS